MTEKHDYASARREVISSALHGLLTAWENAGSDERSNPLRLVQVRLDNLLSQLDDIEPLRTGARELVAADGQPVKPLRTIRNDELKANLAVEISVIRLGRGNFLARGRINGVEFDCNPKQTQLAAAMDVGQQMINPANQQAAVALALALNADAADDARTVGGFF